MTDLPAPIPDRLFAAVLLRLQRGQDEVQIAAALETTVEVVRRVDATRARAKRHRPQGRHR